MSNYNSVQQYGQGELAGQNLGTNPNVVGSGLAAPASYGQYGVSDAQHVHGGHLGDASLLSDVSRPVEGGLLGGHHHHHERPVEGIIGGPVEVGTAGRIIRIQEQTAAASAVLGGHPVERVHETHHHQGPALAERIDTAQVGEGEAYGVGALQEGGSTADGTYVQHRFGQEDFVRPHPSGHTDHTHDHAHAGGPGLVAKAKAAVTGLMPGHNKAATHTDTTYATDANRY